MRILFLSVFYYGSVLYSIVNPAYGLLFFVHIMLLRPENLTWGTPVFGHLHLLTAVAASIGYVVHRHRYVIQNAPANSQNTNVALFALFVCWLVVSSAWAEHSTQASFDVTFDIAKIFVFCFLFSRMLREPEQLMQYVWVASISLGALSFWGVLQGLAGNPRLEDLWGVGTSNVLGALLVLMAPFILGNVLDASLSIRNRLLFLACAISVVLCCIYTDSRGAFLGLAVGMLFLTVQVKQRVKVLVTLALLALLSSPWLPESYFNRVSTIFAEESQRDPSAEARLVLWKIAFRIWQDHPIAGVGLENYSDEKEKYAGKVTELGANDVIAGIVFNTHRVPHSLYFCLLSEVGAVGLVLYLILYFRNAFGYVPPQSNGNSLPVLHFQIKGAQAGLVGFGVAALFGDFYYIEPLYFQLFWVGAARDLLWRRTTESTNEPIPLASVSSHDAVLSPARS